MKLNKTIFAAALFALATSANAQFSLGNLAVLRAGDGAQTLANTGNSIFIDQFTTLGAYVNSVAIPDSGATALIMSGTSSAEGALARSADGLSLTLGGYNTARPFATSLPASTAAAVARGAGSVNVAGTFSLAATTGIQFGGTSTTGGGLRGVVSDGANNYWGVGTANAASGRSVYYFGNNVAANQVQAGVNGRVANIFNGNLYTSTATLISVFSGTPTTGPSTPSTIITGTSSFYDFSVNAANNTIYIADDSITAAGGIQKWTFSGSWSLQYTLATGFAGVGARGLAVDFSGANPLLYATTADGSKIISITDTGAGSLASTIATATAGTVWRGLELTPGVVPEPTTAALLGLGLLLACHRVRSNRAS